MTRKNRKTDFYNMTCSLNVVKDADLIEFIKSKTNASAYIRSLVEADMNRNNQPTTGLYPGQPPTLPQIRTEMENVLRRVLRSLDLSVAIPIEPVETEDEIIDPQAIENLLSPDW